MASEIIRPVFHWYGSKTNVAPWIISQFPPHATYVEVFGGSAAVLLRKKPSPTEVYNDIDSGLVNFFRVLRDEKQCIRLTHLLDRTPYAREEFYEARATWEGETDPVLRAYTWYLVASMSFSGNFGSSWSYAVSNSHHGMGKAVSSWRGKAERMHALSTRLRTVQVDHRPWQDILKAYDTPDTLFYLDPPYVLATRQRREGYRFDFSEQDHKQLVQAISSLKAKVIISGYDNTVYGPLVSAGWQTVQRDVYAHSAANTLLAGKGKGRLSDRRRTEMLWCSHPAA